MHHPAMQPQVVSQFRMKGKRQQVSLSYGNRLSLNAGQTVYLWTDAFNQWGANEDSLQRIP